MTRSGAVAGVAGALYMCTIVIDRMCTTDIDRMCTTDIARTPTTDIALMSMSRTSTRPR